MSPILLAFVLGIIEGLTEFLPVSSTAHLRITQSLLGLELDDAYWKMFSIVIQLGAILSVVFYFKKRLLEFIRKFPLREKPFAKETWTQTAAGLVLIAFVLTAGPAFLLTKIIGKNLESLTVIGTSLWVGGLVMILVDFMFRRHRVTEVEQMNLAQAAWIGLMQIFSAVFPGTSRSMSTIAAGQVVGLSRQTALEFSFFLSVPTMMAATVYDLFKTLRGGLIVSGEQWIWLTIGFMTAFVVSLFVVAGFLKWVRNRGFVSFGLYRIALAIYVLRYLA